MKKTILMLMATLATVIAVSGSAGACWYWGYQPKMPESLKR